MSVICTAEDGSSTEYKIILRRFSKDATLPDFENSDQDLGTVFVIDTEVLKQQIAKSSDEGGTVYLNISENPIVDGQVFIDLAQKPAGKLYIDIGGAKLLFIGENIKNPASTPYDLSYSMGSENSEFILPHFAHTDMTFLFELKSESLPGITRFDIETNFAPGQIVNVYRYDSESGKLVYIAKDITVLNGSVVSFFSENGGEYIISPEYATVSEYADVYSRQAELLGNNSENNINVITIAAICLLCLSAGFCIGHFSHDILKALKKGVRALKRK